VAAVARRDERWRVDLAGVAAASPGPAAPVRVRVHGAAESGIPSLAEALPGDRIRARVRLAAPRALRNPGVPDRLHRTRREGVGGRATLVHPALHVRLPEREGLHPLRGVERLRRRAGRRLAAREEGGALLRALALGQRDGLARSTSESFARLGVSHLLAVSGLHLGLVAALVYGGARALLRRAAVLAARRDARSAALVCALVAAAAYALLAGSGVPVRRALVLLLALAARVLLGRPGGSAAPLAAAALVVLAREPHALFEAGAQLSFAAAAALSGAAAGRPLASRPERGGAGAARRLALDALGASATALLATAPLAAFHLGRSAPLALPVNLVAIPWTAFVLLPSALAAAAAAALPASTPGDALIAGAARIAHLSERVPVALAAALPGDPVPAPPAFGWLVASGLLALAALATSRLGARVAGAVGVGLALALAPPAVVAPGPPRLVVLDVGQGDAVLVQGRSGAVLVDAGLAGPGGIDLGRTAVLPALRALGVARLDLAVATHGDLDHRGGLVAVLGAVPVGALWLPTGGLADPAFGELVAAALRRGVAPLERGAGSPVARVGDLVVEPLWPPSGPARGSRNDRSLVLRVRVGDRWVLLAGDLEADGERRLLASGAELRSDVLKLPHHGSRSSSTRALLDAVAPRVTVASAPCAGRYAMPHPAVLRRVRETGAALWWTGRDGAVLVGLSEPLRVWGTGEPAACP
jgi:competence protein ComEC